MAPGCFNVLWCIRRLPSASNDAVVPQVLAPVEAARPLASTDVCVPVLTEVPVEASDSPSATIGGLRAATAVGSARPRPSGPSPSDAGLLVPSPTRGSMSNSESALAPALIEAQPTGPRSPEESEDASVLAHTEEVPTVSTSAPPRFCLDPAKAREQISRIDRFRVLVMGRANAGKTTILQRVCNTTGQPEIFNGGEMDATVVQGSLKRGYHNIENELVFNNNRHFVFHDSCGFEAGSEQQFNMMKEFVMDRAKTAKLDKRIHAIWFCIPLNESHRMVTSAEKKFFDECDTGHVPVIVLLTKTDTLALDAFQELMDDGLNEDDAMEGVAEVERRNLNDCLVKVKGWLDKSRFPPHDYLSLTGMDSEGADCTALLTCTANALSEEGLQQLLISTQQSNLGLCMEFAIMKTLKECMDVTVCQIEPAGIAYLLSRWFPYRVCEIVKSLMYWPLIWLWFWAHSM
ncbi:hypothetical protein BKA82DRAFT_998898 [Pisolithus tinctorius]|uniref:Uncharacterized protein n=1 Tax=Pisolithus tinctorius Marx 270 TaxID=870435 RepID=A0A0C3PFS9_PISTI|nr:hypothetical protein BKA82DRAFT_998898 [Pisolithus tinctorius]KIO06779.1 hypothetical protein M404DRAFT_998898 [Pisolithus tinctorius Marx 270]